MKSRKNYEELFKAYPDVVTLIQFRKMLGGIADSTARKLVQEDHVEHFYIRDTYFIPKQCAIDYILGKHYAQYKKKLNVQV